MPSHGINAFTRVEPPVASKRKPLGFTLVELLVVITVILVLLALLVPSMDSAIYQAELATCSARMKAAATGVQQYAAEAKRYYPYRAGPRDEDPVTGLQWGPNLIANRFHEDRPTIFAAARSALLLDPFSPKINLETKVADNFITTHYALWFGWVYLRDTQAKGMFKLGDRWTFDGRAYNLLLSDGDGMSGNETNAPKDQWETTTHPDRLGNLHKTPAYQDVVNPWPFWNLHGAYATYSSWTTQNSNGLTRGPLEVNHAYDDGAVLRFTGVVRDDSRMNPVPTHHLGVKANLPQGRGQVPR